MGSKKIPDYKKFKENMNICLTTSQMKDIEKRAEVKEISISKYVRNILFPDQN